MVNQKFPRCYSYQNSAIEAAMTMSCGGIQQATIKNQRILQFKPQTPSNRLQICPANRHRRIHYSTRALPTNPTESAVVELNNIEEYQAFIADTDKTNIVEFYTSWCGVCRSIANKVGKLAVEDKVCDQVRIGKVNLGEVSGAGTLYSELSIK